MNSRSMLGGFAGWFAAVIFCARAQTITPTATFNNIGITVDFAAPPAPSAVRMFLKKVEAPAEPYREVHLLARVASTRYAGSAFSLESGTAYSLKLTSAVFSADQFVTVTTRSEVFPNATNATYHVSPVNGSDSNSDSSSNQAFRTLGKAFPVANAGAKILRCSFRVSMTSFRAAVLMLGLSSLGRKRKAFRLIKTGA